LCSSRLSPSGFAGEDVAVAESGFEVGDVAVTEL
jgi:hypothetical protein